MAEVRTQRRLAAIMAADVVGYSRLIRADEDGTLRKLRTIRKDLIDPILAEHAGRIVKLMGDGMLIEFASVVDAVRAAVAVQRVVAAHRDETGETGRIVFRIGVNLGDVVIDGEDIHGDGVNLASRLEGLAEPGSVCVSEGVYDQVRDRTDLIFEDLGERRVKNIDRPIRVWQWQASHLPAAGSEPTARSLLSDKPSVAVLPFDNMSGDQDQDYFSDGITDDIITELSKLRQLFVISRNSTFTYKGKRTRSQDVCRGLGVRYVLEGGVRKAGGRVRITAQLIDGISGGPLWAERYDRGLEDIFAVQDDVTEKIVRALEVSLVGDAGQTDARVETTIPEAYDCVLRGREQYRMFTKDGNREAALLFKQAIALDPEYAAAYAGLAHVCLHEWFMGVPDGLDRTLELALKARALDPTLPMVFEALGNAYLFQRRYDEAIAAIRNWIEVEPGNAEAYANLAGLLHFAGAPEQVAPLIEKAIKLNPFYPFYYTLYIGQACFAMRQFAAALGPLRRSAMRNPDALPPRIYLAACYGQLGQMDLARDELAEVDRIHPDFSMQRVSSTFVYKNAADLDLLIDGLRKAGRAG